VKMAMYQSTHEVNLVSGADHPMGGQMGDCRQCHGQSFRRDHYIC
jgi:hypothetical protein